MSSEQTPAENAGQPAEKKAPEASSSAGAQDAPAPAPVPGGRRVGSPASRPPQQGRGGRPGGGRPGGGGGRPGGRGRGRGGDREERGEKLIENVVRINRSAAVVKGGRRFSFSALVVVGDGKGRVGIGYGKANGVPNAVEKGVKDARKRMFRVPLVDGTIPHASRATYRASTVVLEPASPGTGIIAGAAVRAVCEAAGLKNILTKCHRSGNPVNVVKAVERGLRNMRTKPTVEALRGVKLPGDAGTWRMKSMKVSGKQPAKAKAQ